MMKPLVRNALILIGFTGLLACSQQASQQPAPQYGSSEPPSPLVRHARLCIAEGQPGSVDPNRAPWAITVSSEGAPCPHSREWGTPRQVNYEVIQPPRHGQITQDGQTGKTVVSYWPQQGYIGSDNFALRYPPNNATLPYLVGVVP
jgi:hypothetical protein